MEFPRLPRAIAAGVAGSLLLAGCKGVLGYEAPDNSAAHLTTACQRWEHATPQQRHDLAVQLGRVARRDIAATDSESAVTPGAAIVAGCQDIVLADIGVGQIMYSWQRGAVTNSLTHQEVHQSEVSPENTEYDLASITKLVTTVGILMMQQEGLLNINDRVGKYVHEYSYGVKAKVTFKMLLEHRSGLIDPPYADVIGYAHNADQVWHNVLSVPLTNPPGTPYTSEANYSNVGFNVAYIAATNAAGISPGEFLLKRVFKPLGMTRTGYSPYVKNCAPTSPDWNQHITRVCLPQDDLADTLGGWAGNAGLFMTVEDLGKFLAMLSQDGTVDGHEYLTPHNMALLEKATNPTGTYGVGDRMNGEGLFGTALSRRAYGHTGWNGGAAVVDPASGLYLAMLMNGTDGRPAPTMRSYKLVQDLTKVLVGATHHE